MHDLKDQIEELSRLSKIARENGFRQPTLGDNLDEYALDLAVYLTQQSKAAGRAA